MARAAQGKWFADALISYAQGYRSFEAVNVPAGAALEPGTLLGAGGSLGPTAPNVAMILLQALPARTAPMPALVLARDAEVNDAYIIYGGLASGAVNGTLAGLGIIVRPGVLPQSIVTASMLDEEGRMIVTEGDPPHEPEPAAA
jgi:hypothetical protein